MKQHRLGGVISVVWIMFFIIPYLLTAQSNVDIRQLKYTVNFSTGDLIFSNLLGYDVVKFRDGDVINDISKPMMPGKEIKIALPKGLAVKTVKIIDTEDIQIEGEYTIFPAQPPLKISEEPDGFVQPDIDVYNLLEPYPGDLVEFIDMTDLAGQSMAVIHLFPLQYVPGEKKLTLYTTLTFVLECEKGYEYGDYLPRNISEEGKRTYEKMIKDMVINPEDVRLQTAPHSFFDGRALPAGSYDHVIITSTSYQSYWNNLVNWHTKRGLKDTVVTTTYIYANYTGDDQQKIRSFVIDAHSTWGTMYFLLGGEHNTVPFEYHTWTDESTPSDQYYSDYDDDWTHEVYVGRASISNSTEANTFINKVLNYEKNPPLTDYILNVLLIGMDADAYTDLEDLKENIDGVTPDIPARFNVTKVYDSHGGNHETYTKNALNAGQNLVNHADHGWYNYMGTGDYNHGWGINNSEVDVLTNNGKPSIVTSLACDPNGMDYSSYDCIAEHFVIYNPNQAGVAFNGNTRSGYYYQGQPISLSGTLDRDWWRAVFDYYETTLGEAINRAKHLFSHSNNDKKHCEWTFNLLGEPAMPIWTATPENFTVVDYPATLPIGSSSFTVHVEDAGGNVSNAYVCLWKGDEVYLTGNTNTSGNVTLYPAPSTEGTMYVTVTKYDYNDNYLPYEGTAEVIEESPPFIVQGDCYYQDMTPVDPVFVEIYNLNTEERWDADISTNHYSLELEPDNDVNDGDVLRIIGKDEETWVNVTDHTVTPSEITGGGFTLDLTLDEYYRDVSDFPMYLAGTPYDAKSGAAVAQMALNYMHWDSAVSDTPLMTYPQSQVYDTALIYSGAGPLIDVAGVWKALQILRPLPYSEYGYNFNKYSNVDSTIMLKLICEWIDYTIGTYGGHKDGYPYHVPGIIPAYGGYTNWMAVRGIHTDTVAYPPPGELSVYGFWMNDPYPYGIGENTYKTVIQFLDNYYDPLNTSDNWHGKYVGICEPPEDVNQCELIIVPSKPRFNAMQIDQLKRIDYLTDLPDYIDAWVIQAAIDGVREELIPYDEKFEAVFEKVVPNGVIFVQSLNNDDDYFAVTFINNSAQGEINKSIPKNEDKANYDKASVVILIDAEDGSFKEASWTENPAKYLPLSDDEAIEIALVVAEKLGIEVIQHNLQPELVHRRLSPYYPEWRFIMNPYEVYISQEGFASVEELGDGGKGGGPMSEDGSIAYSFSTGAPSPFTKATNICYSIAQPGHVSLNIYDVSGRLVKILVQEDKDVGVYSIQWNGCDNNNQQLAPGVYFTKLASGDFVSVKKLILMK